MRLPTYPPVLSERATLEQAFRGMNLARFGDGELKLALGRDAKSQQYHPDLAAALRAILLEPTTHTLACIPHILENTGPKADFWAQYRRPPYVALYDPRKCYGSAFVTRPDSAPIAGKREFQDRLTELWAGQDVILVRGSSKSFTAADLLPAAKSVREIIAPRQHAWTWRDRLLRQVVALDAAHRGRVILCLGATATVLAWDLGQVGVHAVDLGHAGMFLRREGRFDRESFPA